MSEPPQNAYWAKLTRRERAGAFITATARHAMSIPGRLFPHSSPQESEDFVPYVPGHRLARYFTSEQVEAQQQPTEAANASRRDVRRVAAEAEETQQRWQSRGKGRANDSGKAPLSSRVDEDPVLYAPRLRYSEFEQYDALQKEFKDEARGDSKDLEWKTTFLDLATEQELLEEYLGWVDDKKIKGNDGATKFLEGLEEALMVERQDVLYDQAVNRQAHGKTREDDREAWRRVIKARKEGARGKGTVLEKYEGGRTTKAEGSNWASKGKKAEYVGKAAKSQKELDIAERISRLSLENESLENKLKYLESTLGAQLLEVGTIEQRLAPTLVERISRLRRENESLENKLKYQKSVVNDIFRENQVLSSALEKYVIPVQGYTYTGDELPAQQTLKRLHPLFARDENNQLQETTL